MLLFSLLQLFANISFDESSTQEGTVGIDSAALTCKVKQANQKVRTCTGKAHLCQEVSHLDTKKAIAALPTTARTMS